MRNKIVIFVVLAIFTIVLGGCATARKQNDLEMQGLKNQITALEAQLQSKDEEIGVLKESLSKTTEQKVSESKTGTTQEAHKKVAAVAKAHPTHKQVQIALKNAGYYSGTIDGKLGKQTRQAIKEFQKANNLTADGKMRMQTWNLLKEYLVKKAK